MRLIDLGPRTGKFADVVATTDGWVTTWQDDGVVVLETRSPSAVFMVSSVHLPCVGGNAFPVLWPAETGSVWWAWRDGASSHGILRNNDTGQHIDLGPVHGNAPICFGAGFVAYQATADYQIQARDLRSPDVVIRGRWIGRPTGLAWNTADGPVLVDDARQLVRGMVNPRHAGSCWVGENADVGPNRNIARLGDGRECALWVGLDSFTPRIATDGTRFAVVTWGGPGVRLALLEDADFVVPAPPPPPPQVPPDIPWTPDPTKTVDVGPFIDAASTARLNLPGDRCIWWLKKSPERDDWGEWWHADGNYIGLLEDRSTAYRKVWHEGKLLRLSPEEVVAGNNAGKNYGDPFTLPLHSYTLRPYSLWMPRRFTGTFFRRYRTDYVWHEWEHWRNLPIQIEAEAGYARFAGHEVHMRMVYRKASGWEVNYLGFTGWRRFESYREDGTEEIEARRTTPFESQGAAKGPYVEPRFQPQYPIVGEPEPPAPPQEPEPMQLPTDEQMVNAMRRIHIEGYMGHLKRAGGIFEAPDPAATQIRDGRFHEHNGLNGAHIDDYSLSVWTGRYVRYFAQAIGGDPHERAIRAVLTDLYNSDEARQKRGEQPPPAPPQTLRGPIGVSGRDFEVPS